ncbi:sensor histidine kinase [Jiella sp. M17.18]|uniref:sensor histidine kinase n=1 Tax=Jiella sp. M17.18 TaxID=3234247 RepID=UPI0034DFC9A9
MRRDPRPRPAGSLRVRLIVWMIVPITAILGVSLWLSFASAFRQATLVMHRQLLSSARMIAEQTRYRDDAIRVVVPPAALELFSTDNHDEVSYAVFDRGGDLIAGFPGLDPPDPLPASFDALYLPRQFRDEAMDAVVLRQPVIAPTGVEPVVVMVGETLKAREAMVRSLWLSGFLEQAALVVAAAIAIWVGITWELQPLLRLRRAVLDRPADAFEPFSTAAVQSEVRPLVQALNDHMTRLSAYLQRQRRFLDSTAHQLRTPLAVMKTQVALARRGSDPAEVSAVLAEIDGTLTAMARVTSQLLTLGRVEHERAQLAVETVDLSALARDVAATIAPLALDAGVELAVNSDGPCIVAASTVLLRETVANLVDNAVVHAGSGAVATVSVARNGQMAVLTVSDTGRGIAPQDRARVFQRFQRGHDVAGGGSGLGLAIVAEIAEMFAGWAELIDPPCGKGFAVRLSLPLAQRPAASTKALV